MIDLDLGAGVRQHIEVRDDLNVSDRYLSLARSNALPVADDLRATLPNDDEIAAVEALVTSLGADRRLIAFFTSGATSLASQSIAQFAGWNIPGVGEGDQRFRPRTRLYDTCDPDTIAQVRETLDYDRTALLFIDDDPPDPLNDWAAALLPTAAERIGPALGERLAVVNSRGECTGVASESLSGSVSTYGGHTLSVRNIHGLSTAALIVGIARGLDLRDVRRGARVAIDQVASEASQSDDRSLSSLIWPAYIAQSLRGAHGETKSPVIMDLLPASDRLARFSVWASSVWMNEVTAQLSVSAYPQAISGLRDDQIGHKRSLAGERFIEFHSVSGAVESAFHRRLREMASDTAASDLGTQVRTLSLAAYTSDAYGALAARAIFEARLAGAIIAEASAAD